MTSKKAPETPTDDAPAGASKRKGKIMDAPGGFSEFLENPFKVTIVGLDTPAKRGDLCFDPQVVEARTPERQYEFEVLRDGMRAGGQLQPVGLVKDGNRFLVDFGRNRTMAAREITNVLRWAANLPPLAYGDESPEGDPIFRLRVFVRRDVNERKAFHGQVAENRQRVSRTPSALAEEILTAKEVYGYSMDDIRAMFGIPATVDPMIYTKLLGLTDELRAAVDTGEVKVSTGVRMAETSREEQREALEDHRSGKKKLTAESARQRAKGNKTHTAPPKRALSAMAKDGLLSNELRALLMWFLDGDKRPLEEAGISTTVLSSFERATAPKAKKAPKAAAPPKAPKAKKAPAPASEAMLLSRAARAARQAAKAASTPKAKTTAPKKAAKPQRAAQTASAAGVTTVSRDVRIGATAPKPLTARVKPGEPVGPRALPASKARTLPHAAEP